jgi:SAM-dependent methyltransferase
MHTTAMEWVQKFATDDNITILDLGGRDINGTPRPLFPNSVYTTLDLLPGDNVHIVADAATWVPTRQWDLVLCTEVFEHTPAWPLICQTAFKALRPGGMFVTTMAGPGRGPHSGVDGENLKEGEHYQNIEPEWLRLALEQWGFVDIEIEHLQGTYACDVRAVARKAE